jgi:hypothetical protein
MPDSENALRLAAMCSWRTGAMHLSTIPACQGPDPFLGVLATAFNGAINYGFIDYLGPVAPIVGSKLGNQF